MTRIALIALLLTTALAPAPAAKPICHVVRERSCQCYTKAGWKPFPMLACTLTRRATP